LTSKEGETALSPLQEKATKRTAQGSPHYQREGLRGEGLVIKEVALTRKGEVVSDEKKKTGHRKRRGFEVLFLKEREEPFEKWKESHPWRKGAQLDNNRPVRSSSFLLARRGSPGKGDRPDAS